MHWQLHGNFEYRGMQTASGPKGEEGSYDGMKWRDGRHGRDTLRGLQSASPLPYPQVQRDIWTEEVQLGTNSSKAVINIDKWGRQWRSIAVDLDEELVVCRINYSTSFMADASDYNSRVDSCAEVPSPLKVTLNARTIRELDDSWSRQSILPYLEPELDGKSRERGECFGHCERIDVVWVRKIRGVEM